MNNNSFGITSSEPTVVQSELDRIMQSHVDSGQFTKEQLAEMRKAEANKIKRAKARAKANAKAAETGGEKKEESGIIKNVVKTLAKTLSIGPGIGPGIAVAKKYAELSADDTKSVKEKQT